MSKRTHKDPDHTGADIVELQQQQAQLVKSMRETETLLREVHHRVKNNLQVVVSLLTTQADAASDRTVTQALSEAATRVSTVALIHAMLSESASLAYIDLAGFIRSLVSNVQRTFGDSTTTVTLTLSLDGLVLPLQQATPCGLLINELVTNAFRHAFAGAEAAHIEIRAHAKDGVATIVVQDNGHGLPPEGAGAGSHGIGLQLMQALAIKQLHGKLTVTRVNGSEFTVKFPYSGGSGHRGGEHGPGQSDDR